MKQPIHKTSLTLTLALAAAPAAAQQDDSSLIFSSYDGSGYERTVSITASSMLDQLNRHDLSVIAPAPGASAATFLAHSNFDVMHGDKDCDSVFFDANTGWAIDAVTLCQNVPDPRMQNVYVSFVSDIGTPGSTPVIENSDIVSLRPGGAHQKLISEDQIKSAMGISMADDINIDAFCMLDDSSPNSGAVLFNESTADLFVANSDVSDTSGTAVVTIDDLDALTVDEDGSGSGLIVQVPSTGAMLTLPDLLFSGSNLVGAAVVSTASGGSVAQLNGEPLASHVPLPTLGLAMGMVPGSAPVVRSLSALCLVRDDADLLRFVLDTNSALPTVGSSLRLDWGGADSGAPVQILAKIGVPGTCGAQASNSIPNPGFGYWFTSSTGALITLPVLSSRPQGFGSLVAPFAGPLIGIPVIFQALTKKSGFQAPFGSGFRHSVFSPRGRESDHRLRERS